MTTDFTTPINTEGLSDAEIEERHKRHRIANNARDFIIRLGSMMRQLRMHAATNQSVRDQIKRTEQAIATLREDSESVSVVFAEGHSFVNGIWVRATRLMWDHSVSLTDALTNLGARGIVLEAKFATSSVIDLATVLLNAPSRVPGTKGATPINVPGVRLIPAPEDNHAGYVSRGRASLREKARHIMREGMLVLDPGQARTLDLFMRRRQRSLVEKLIRLGEESMEDLLALTAIRDPTLPEGSHTLTVTIFSIAIGKMMGLSRRELVSLGTSSLNHNLGETFTDRGLVAQPRQLTREERQNIEIHPLMGMFHVLHQYGFDRSMLDRAIASAEHHITWNGKSGYPFATHVLNHPYSRVISVADLFSALVSDRPHREAYPPDQGLKLVIRQAESQIDPVIVRVFMGLVGRYPPATVVELDTGEWGVVVGAGKGVTPLKRPRVLIVTDEDGFEIPTDNLYVVDLGERHKRRRAWIRTIVRTQDPKMLEMKVSAYLLADRIEQPPEKLDTVEFAERKEARAAKKR